MWQARAYCDLRLTFALERSGQYVADTHLRLRNGDGKDLFDIEAVGLMFYVHLLVGKFTVVAERLARVQTIDVIAPAQGSKDLYLFWDDE